MKTNIMTNFEIIETLKNTEYGIEALILKYSDDEF